MIYTSAPFERRVVAIISQMPVPPPVTTATTPDMSKRLAAVTDSTILSAIVAVDLGNVGKSVETLGRLGLAQGPYIYEPSQSRFYVVQGLWD